MFNKIAATAWSSSDSDSATAQDAILLGLDEYQAADISGGLLRRSLIAQPTIRLFTLAACPWVAEAARRHLLWQAAFQRGGQRAHSSTTTCQLR